ncbi:hypothetical protein [Streptacidiphilus sp. PAMC 29251]
MKEAGRTATIYALSDPRTPHDYRYVGRSVALTIRLNAHVTNALSRMPNGDWRYRVTHKIAWIRALAREGYHPHVTVLAEVPRKDRIVAECQWIHALREAGFRLTNATSGGEGPEQYNPTVQTRARQSAANRRRFENNPVERAFYSRLMTERYAGPEGRRRLSAQTKMQWAKPGAKEAHSALLKAVCAQPEVRQRKVEAMRRMFEGERGAMLRAELSARSSGDRNPAARLTWENVREIRCQYALGNVTQKCLATKFGVSPSLIGQIVRCRIWVADPLVAPIPLQRGRTPARRYCLDAEHMASVVRLYREAHAAGRPPAIAVAEEFGVTSGTAEHWFVKCRKGGLLGKAIPGRAGERAFFR